VHFVPIFWRKKKFKLKAQLCNFWWQNFICKLGRKMLMKLMPGVNLINILYTAFAPADPKSVKRYTDDLTVFIRFRDL